MRNTIKINLARHIINVDDCNTHIVQLISNNINCDIYQWIMGYDLHRFQGDVDEELTCPICSGVLEEPLQVHNIA